MAYMSQEKKAKIATQLKTIIPKSWKWSLGVRHHSTLVLRITAAPLNLLADVQWYEDRAENYASINVYHFHKHFKGETLATVEKIIKAMNTDNHDNSDVQTDYFDVGHYIELKIGEWDKPFIVRETVAA